ncbi:MAG TPA: radical SAM family heme chaperone HemW [Dissulfurispiraceae bacterium]|nr:radical SAM family heme chaperone HemW [Dissulfurispiraceae bacterium]
MQKAGALYIHIPFCVRKCTYCDFCSEPLGMYDTARFVRSLCAEIRQRSDEFGSVESLFFGGGTPSLLSEASILSIMQCLKDVCDFSPDPEVTIEANPATVDEKRLSLLREAGFNRISIGIQSVHGSELQFLGRIHDWAEAEAAVHDAGRAGFDNISVDAMYGIPGQDAGRWRETLRRLIELKPVHISAYELTPEPGTPLFQALQSGLYSLPPEETIEAMFYCADEMLSACGYEHYEISNYALPGRRCMHNMTYWQRRPYAGLGPAAHSFNGLLRSSNIEDIHRYIALLETAQSVAAGTTVLNDDDVWKETVFLGLRTIDGVCRADLAPEIFTAMEKALQNERLQGLVVTDACSLRLTQRGRLLSNEVIATILSGIEKRLRAQSAAAHPDSCRLYSPPEHNHPA